LALEHAGQAKAVSGAELLGEGIRKHVTVHSVSGPRHGLKGGGEELAQKNGLEFLGDHATLFRGRHPVEAIGETGRIGRGRRGSEGGDLHDQLMMSSA
jgi:hypothetical protein